jgi:GDP-4-dehydro-6-deoxy-D-mannose reductase
MKATARALVTGAAGFCGKYLSSYLSEQGYLVIGFDRLDALHPELESYTSDVTDSEQVRAVVDRVGPSDVFHLAALTDPRLGYRELHRVNALGTLSVLNAVHHSCPSATVLVVSSSAVYGRACQEDLPITERQPFHPANAYAVSKVVQEMVSYHQFIHYDLRVIRTRAFNITGPGQRADFVTSAFARQIAEIEAGWREPVVEVGNLESVRDFIDVRDAVRAYQLVADQGKPGEVYNICSGQGTSIGDLLNWLLELSTQRDISVQIEPSRLRLADVPIQIGDASKLRALTGWSPAIPLRQTLVDMLDYWRTRIKEEHR